ncbi:MAG: DNA repair protein RadA [Alphaproteobacteria bacterium CG11_big_fil_rev_8_21_14_0_20_39_49]|nr:MAG: DNA repair protein RadA [Alphaproteobacteria bacterium CG11_big_fil_rev_8_21_14_0_20_39_49]
MAKSNTSFICQECGTVHKKWSGMCSGCNAWDSIVEEVNEGYSSLSMKKAGQKIEFVPLSGKAKDVDRGSTGISELDRVLGGGLVSGAAILIGGDPGIGKSTLVLQTVSSISLSGVKTAYITGEESVDQVRLRARRLGLNESPVNLMSATNVKDIIASINSSEKPDVVVIDSIQTMFIEEMGSAPGTVSQVRSSAHELISFAKKKNITMLIVGHVTKEGQIAGPKVLEHMVDTVLYFEGERGHQFRILRAIKNRFGAANEIGVFEMCEKGLVEVPNPSALFLSSIGGKMSGSTVFAGMEGTRPVLLEIQALVASTPVPTPRRAVVGWDSNRLAMIIAVLQTRYGIFLADKEIYLNVAGGLKINEPAADLAVAIALISSFVNKPLPYECVIFGELGLSGEVRMVGQSDIRLKESKKLGFASAIVPYGVKNQNNSFILKQIRHIRELASFFEQEKQIA